MSCLLPESPRLVIAGERATAVLEDGVLTIFAEDRDGPPAATPLLVLRVRHDVTLELVEPSDPGIASEVAQSAS